MSRWVARSPVLAICAISAIVVACGDSNDDGPQSKARKEATEPAQTASADGRSGAEGADRQRPNGAKAAKKSDGTQTDRAASGSADLGASPDPPAGANGDEREIGRVVTGMYRDFADGDAAAVCAAMSEAVRREIAGDALGGSSSTSGAGTCETSLSMFLDAAAASGIRERSLNATVKTVTIDGNRAVALISIGGGAGKVRLVNEQGKWRFGDTPLK